MMNAKDSDEKQHPVTLNNGITTLICCLGLTAFCHSSVKSEGREFIYLAAYEQNPLKQGQG